MACNWGLEECLFSIIINNICKIWKYLFDFLEVFIYTSVTKILKYWQKVYTRTDKMYDWFNFKVNFNLCALYVIKLNVSIAEYPMKYFT